MLKQNKQQNNQRNLLIQSYKVRYFKYKENFSGYLGNMILVRHKINIKYKNYEDEKKRKFSTNFDLMSTFPNASNAKKKMTKIIADDARRF